jgi:hypothetical protein
MKAIIALALVASPALADVYRCNPGGKTVYQDVPCANAKVIDNVNALPPTRAEQMKAVERANQDRRLAASLSRNRESNERSVVTVTQTAITPRPASLRPNGPDRYYDRPDRFEHRTVTGPVRVRAQNP